MGTYVCHMPSYDGAEPEVSMVLCSSTTSSLHSEHRHNWFSGAAVLGMPGCAFSSFSISTMTLCSCFFQVQKMRVSCWLVGGNVTNGSFGTV